MEGQGGRDSLVWLGTTTAWWDGGASIWRMDFGGRVVPTLVELKWGPNQRRAGGY